jgi:hypothetical protein
MDNRDAPAVLAASRSIQQRRMASTRALPPTADVVALSASVAASSSAPSVES